MERKLLEILFIRDNWLTVSSIEEPSHMLKVKKSRALLTGLSNLCAQVRRLERKPAIASFWTKSFNTLKTSTSSTRSVPPKQSVRQWCSRISWSTGQKRKPKTRLLKTRRENNCWETTTSMIGWSWLTLRKMSVWWKFWVRLISISSNSGRKSACRKMKLAGCVKAPPKSKMVEVKKVMLSNQLMKKRTAAMT